MFVTVLKTSTLHFGENKKTLELYNLRPFQVPYDKADGDSVANAWEEVFLTIGEQVLHKKPGFGDFTEFTYFKNEEEKVIGAVRHYGITYRGVTIGFVLFNDGVATFIPGNDVGQITISPN
jgi:hypothetical protein